MKRLIAMTAVIVMLVGGSIGCTQQSRARQFGGDMTITLPVGEKLETATWKDTDLFYLTRPMRVGETPETHKFRESSSLGVWQSTVTFVESR